MQIDGELIQQARSLFESGDFVGAEKAYRDLVDELPEGKRVDLELIIGACQQAQGRNDDAVETMQRAVELDGSRAESWFQLARARRQAGDEDGASEALQQAIVLDPNHAMARVERARQCQAAGDGESAEAHFRTALRADPDCVPALVGLAERRFEEGQLDKAQELAAQAVQQQPRSVPAQIVMARVFRHRGHPDFAERCLDNALEAVPDSPELHAAKAQLLFERGRLDECLAAVARAKNHGSTDGRLIVLELKSLRRLGLTIEARQLLERVARAQPLDPAGQLMLAELRLETGDAEAVGELLEGLEEAWPAAGQLIRAELAARGGDRASAAELAGGLHDDSNSHIRQQARLLGARLALSDDEPHRCIELLEPLAGEGEADPRVHWMLARAHDRAGRYEKAAEHLPHTGWYLPPVLRSRHQDMPEALYGALGTLQTEDWQTQVPEDGRPLPVFVFGWPGSGREALLDALAESGGMSVLGRENGERRREALELPAWPERLAAVDDAKCRLVRRRYLREVGTDPDRVLEPMWLPVAALPAIARFFPGATVVLADAELRDLELDWRLAGFRGLDTLRGLWQLEQVALERMLETLPLDFHVFSRSDLEHNPGEVAAELGRQLALEDPAPLAEAIESRLKSQRPTGHWRHYSKLFEGGPID